MKNDNEKINNEITDAMNIFHIDFLIFH